jgi:hypothetical protein
VKKVKVREEDLAPYKQSYEVSQRSWRGVAWDVAEPSQIAMKRLREFFGRGH